MTSSNRVCVVMPSYESPTLERAARSVLAQDVEQLTLAISIYPDDSDTRRRAESLGDPRVIIVQRSGYGISNARNSALRAVPAELYMFLDSDDAYAPGTIARYLLDKEEHPDSCLRYADWTAVSPLDGSHKRRRMYVPRSRAYEQLLLGNFIATGTVMVEAEVIQAAGGFDERYPHAEDWDLWLRVARRYPLRYVPVNATFYTRTKIGTAYPRSHFTHEVAVIRSQPAPALLRWLATALAYGRYGAYYAGTLRARRSVKQLLDLRPHDCALAPAAVALRLYRYAVARARSR